MTQTRQLRIAELEAEIAKLKEEEKASRPELAPGQVWRSAASSQDLITFVRPAIHPNTEAVGIEAIGAKDGEIYSDLSAGVPDAWFFVGLARDILRVVEPTPEPDPEPTGAELVGKRCWRRLSDKEQWEGPNLVIKYDVNDASFPYLVEGEGWWAFAKLYREGVEP